VVLPYSTWVDLANNKPEPKPGKVWFISGYRRPHDSRQSNVNLQKSRGAVRKGESVVVGRGQVKHNGRTLRVGQQFISGRGDLLSRLPANVREAALKAAQAMALKKRPGNGK
jgi:hypothetical protein